jgi:hypothetical protein
MIYFGIDPGVNTGLAYVHDGELKACITTNNVEAMEKVLASKFDGQRITVVFEDARQRKYLPRERNASEYRGKLMGAGSVKRDCEIWQTFCEVHCIPFIAVPPRAGATKWTAETFRNVTGYKGRTSNHARDAALLVFGRK